MTQRSGSQQTTIQLCGKMNEEEKITMKKKLAREALYQSHLSREDQHQACYCHDAQRVSNGVTDIESTDVGWKQATERIRNLDPNGDRAIALFRKNAS